MGTHKKNLASVTASLIVFAFAVVFLFFGFDAAPSSATYALEDILNITNLPVVCISIEDGNDINRSDKVEQNAQFSLITQDGKGDLSLSAIYDEDTGDVTYPMVIKGRGRSSWSASTRKKPYNIKFSSKQDLLDMGKQKSYSLIANWVDSSYLRNYLAYNMGSLFGDSMSMDCRLVELVINDEYQGIYLLTEKAGLGSTRIVTAGDGTDGLDGFSSGDGVDEPTKYMLEADVRARFGSEPNCFRTSTSNIWIVVKDMEPNIADVPYVDGELDWLKDYLDKVDKAITELDNYEDYIDVDSLIDVYLLNEIAKNPDFGFGNQPCYASTFMYLEEGGKLYFGSIWDFDIAFGRNDYSTSFDEGYRNTLTPSGYLTRNTTWINTLFTDPEFVEAVKARYAKYRDQIWDEVCKLPEAAALIEPSVETDLSVWGDEMQRTTKGGRKIPLTFDREVNYIMEFVKLRLEWLDLQWLPDSPPAQ